MPAPRTTEPPLPHAHRPQSPHPLRLSRPLARKTRHQRDDSADLSALFSQDIPKQKSAADIHTHLWNLSLALQQGRISPRRAAVLAYISSLLLRTLPAIEKKEHPVDRGGLTIGDAPRPIRNLPPPHHPPSQYSPGAYATPSSCVPSAPKLYGFRPATPSAASSFPRGECGESSDSHPAFSASSA